VVVSRHHHNDALPLRRLRGEHRLYCRFSWSHIVCEQVRLMRLRKPNVTVWVAVLQ